MHIALRSCATLDVVYRRRRRRAHLAIPIGKLGSERVNISPISEVILTKFASRYLLVKVKYFKAHSALLDFFLKYVCLDLNPRFDVSKLQNHFKL